MLVRISSFLKTVESFSFVIATFLLINFFCCLPAGYVKETGELKRISVENRILYLLLSSLLLRDGGETVKVN